MATTRRQNAPKSICNSNPKYGSINHRTAQEKMRNPQAKAGQPLPQLYVDTITAAFGEDADLHSDVLKISPDAVAIEQRIAYFKRGREIMKEAGSAISAPRDLPPPIRARLKAVNMAYEIISNPEWQREYEARNVETPRIKAGVRFNDTIQEHFFEREPWEEEYMRQKRERRMQRLKELEDSDALSLDAFWADIMKDLDSFELGLDGFLQAFPDQMSSSSELKESPSDDSSFPDTQSFSSWMSNSVKFEDREFNEDIETSSYMSSFNPFAEETKRTSRKNVRSPTSLPQELGETSRSAGKTQNRNGNLFPDDLPSYDEDDATNPLDVSPVTNPTFDDDDDATNPYEDGALDVTPDDVSNPFSEAASDSRFSIGTFQKMQKQQKARRSTRSSGNPNKEQSKSHFGEDPNDASGDQNSVFDGLDEVWEDDGVHVDGVSVISDLSESVVAKRAKQKQQPFDPFGSAKGGTRGSSSSNNNNSNNKISPVTPSWGGTEQEQVGFTAAASAIAACCANMVADCQKNTQALANMELKNFTGLDKAALPSLFEKEETKTLDEDDPFDEMQELFDEMGDELTNELGGF